MKRFKVNFFSCLVAAVLIPLLLTTAVAQAQAAPWTVVKSPNPLAGGNQLNGVASVSANDVWAVGVALTLHWNGKKWSVVKSPNTGPANQLYAVAAVSTNDVWAVGFFQTVSGTRQTLTLHWNGHKWSIVASPNPGSADNFFLAVAAVSTNDVWAVGEFSTVSSPFVFQTLIEHWDGTSWSVVASPNPGSADNFLNGVTAVSTSDIWAVGSFIPNASSAAQTLTLHWNGTSWSVVPSPGTSDDILQAAAAVSTNDVWAVGSLIEHWNGTSWSVVSSPGAGGLKGVAIVSANDIWAVGDSNTSPFQTLIEQWNGTTWSVVASPNVGSGDNFLNAAAADPSSAQAWAVGDFANSSQQLQTLTEFNP